MDKLKVEKTVLKGTLILTATSFIVKILSAVYRVPFQNLVGDEGFYVYQQVYPIYGIAMTLSLSGMPVFLSKILASEESPIEKKRLTNQFFLLCQRVIRFLISRFVHWCTSCGFDDGG